MTCTMHRNDSDAWERTSSSARNVKLPSTVPMTDPAGSIAEQLANSWHERLETSTSWVVTIVLIFAVCPDHVEHFP